MNIGFIAFQVLLCELLIEWIRQSFLYAPNLINSMMGFLVVFVLGDFGVEMGAYTKEILLDMELCKRQKNFQKEKLPLVQAQCTEPPAT